MSMLQTRVTIWHRLLFNCLLHENWSVCVNVFPTEDAPDSYFPAWHEDESKKQSLSAEEEHIVKYHRLCNVSCGFFRTSLFVKIVYIENARPTLH